MCGVPSVPHAINSLKQCLPPNTYLFIYGIIIRIIIYFGGLAHRLHAMAMLVLVPIAHYPLCSVTVTNHYYYVCALFIHVRNIDFFRRKKNEKKNRKNKNKKKEFVSAQTIPALMGSVIMYLFIRIKWLAATS